MWKLDRRPRNREAETFKVLFFWTSVVVTIVLLAFALRVIWVDRGWATYLLLLPLGCDRGGRTGDGREGALLVRPG